MIADALEHMAQVGFRIQTVELGSADQAVDGGGALASSVGTAEEEVLAPERNGAQRALGGVVVDLEAAICRSDDRAASTRRLG